MIPTTFEYQKASSVDEAISLLQANGGDTKILAGGHSLIPTMKLRLAEPEKLVDIGRLPELNYIKEDGGHIAIGACTTHQQITDSALIQEHLPMMSQAGALIGDIQVRNKGTIGGSIAHADPAADWPGIVVASGAEVVIRGLGGERSVAGTDFFQGIYMTALADNEIITEIRIPKPAAGTKSAYAKFMQPASRYAIVGCAAMVTLSGGVCEDVRIGFTGVAGSAFRDAGVENALNGNKLDETNIKAASDQAANGISVLGDHFASSEYRQQMAKVYAKRALMALL